MKDYGHIPVLLDETVSALNPVRGGVYADGTLGRAGHACELLKRAGVATLIGIDRDPRALAESGLRLRETCAEADVRLVHGVHGDIARIVREAGFEEVDGVLLDLGVSSPQLDEAARGFSFMKDGPLDMRMDPGGGETAADVVNTRGEEELTDIFRAYGEEPHARRIAKAIVRERAHGGFRTTLQLAEFVSEVVGRHGAHHPATRVFQALRMVVNDEPGELERALEGGLGLLKAGGRFAVITFESLSDRVVKKFFIAHEGRMVSLQQGGARWEGELPRVRRVFRRAVTASEKECGRNTRSRSAKLRVVERV